MRLSLFVSSTSPARLLGGASARATSSFVGLRWAHALGVCAALTACTTGTQPMLPDVYLVVDSGGFDAGTDGGSDPDPTVDTCRDPGGTVGQACVNDDDCDDGCYCNGSEACNAGTCGAGSDPCGDTIGCTDDACLEETNTCFHMPNSARCQNGMACDGFEQCDRLRDCLPGAPLYCNDENACTVDSCDDSMGCVYTPRDLDRDGYIAGTCGGDDCDDDPRYGTEIFPGAPEVCDNRRDDNCDGRRDFSDASCRPMNDTCALASVIPARTGTYSGSTAGLAANYTFGCMTGLASDAVFRFTLTEAHDVRITVSGSAGAGVSLRDFASCASGPELKCSGASPPSVLSRSLPAGDYAILVRTPTPGAFDISLAVTDPTPVPAFDVCGPATERITASGTYTGRFEEASDDYRLSCHSSGSWRDAAYRIVLDAPADLVLSARTSGAPFGSSAYVSLVTDCVSATGTLQCAVGGTAEIRRRGVPAGTYYVLVESSAADATAWTLNVTITSPPAPRAVGDACTSAVSIPFMTLGDGSTRGTGSASLATAELDSGTSCGGSTAGNRDVFFSFTLTEPRDVTLSTSAGTSFHYAELQNTCGAAPAEPRCRSGASPVAQSWRSLPAGTYYVAVATGIVSGTVSVTVDTRTATMIPPNDRCAGGITLTNGASRTDTLVGFADDLVGCSGSGFPDSFYTFTLDASRRVIISAATLAGAGRLYLTLRNTCTAAPAVTGGCVNGAGSATINTVLPAGTYSLEVEMSTAEATDFSLSFVTI